MRDESGMVQLWTVSPCGGEPAQVTHLPFSVSSAFTWSPDGQYIAFIADRSVFVAQLNTGHCFRLTHKNTDADAPLPLAAVFSPNGRHIAYEQRVMCSDGKRFNQIFVVKMPDHL
jgi:Tol biopolymer transport system component